jgi:alpha-mannosidase
MHYEDLIVLIPSHSLEDFPAELGEEEAASILNSFAVAWHPALLADAKVLPRWHRADDPPDGTQKRLIFVPKSCESWIPGGWAERVAGEGCTVVRGHSERSAILSSALAPWGGAIADELDIIGDFLALGFAYLQIELLTRKMRHFSNLDEVHLQREAVAAAEAALAGDGDTARTRLTACFESLAQARERFYPVDCYLIDLCLVIPRLADEHLRNALATRKPISVLASAADLDEIAAKTPESSGALRDACQAGTADLVCGDLCERPLPLLPLESVLWQLDEAGGVTTRLFHKPAVVWGRRRYGVFPLLPQILKKAGFLGALHVVLDDGIYPDAEQSKVRWEGTGGTSIDAWSRIPLAADAAVSYLRFPDRMSESMDNDHVAAVALARWPEVKAPFFVDLRRIHNYAPVLGKFINFTDFFQRTDSPTRHASYKPGEYLTPYLFQSAAREEENGISRFQRHVSRRARLDSGIWLSGLGALLTGRGPEPSATAALERDVELLGEQPAADAVANIERRLEQLVADSSGKLANLILKGAPPSPGYLVFNTLGFRRVVTVALDPRGPVPRPTGEKSWVQWGGAHHALTVDVPGSGFVWVPAGFEAAAVAAPEAPLAVPGLLRNEFFEVHLNETTGGVAQIKGYGRSPNRLSQQLNYRFSRERTVTVGEGERAEQTKSHYGEMRQQTSAITCAGPALGEIVTTGEIVDQTSGTALAGFRQTVRLWRGRPIVEIDVALDVRQMPDGEPWHNYFAARFAWHDETASLTRSAMMGAHETAEERIESLHYLEIATPEQRTTILAPGLPFHRKTGPRMIDTLLIVPRETERTFRFTIAVDQDFPMESARDALSPAVVVPTQSGPPNNGAAGWFFHLGTRQVQVVQMLPLVAEPVAETAAPNPQAAPVSNTSAPSGCGAALRLVETEGRPVRARLRCFRAPVRARQRDLRGKTICELAIDGDAVLVDLNSYEIADIEVRFD